MPRQIPPMDMKFVFDMPTAAATYFLDVGQICSLVNRKAMRQGYEYFISNIEVITNGDFISQISTLPQSWVGANSWTKSFKLWQESRDQVLDIDGPGIQGKYADFKVYFDSVHEVAGVAGNLRPYNFAIADADGSYDWEASIIEFPNTPVPGTTTGYNLHFLGPSTGTSKGMIAGYAASRRRPVPEDPNVVDVASTEAWMRELFDVGDNLDEIRDNLETLNDQPPYLIGDMEVVKEFYPGGAYQASTFASYIQDILVTRKSTSLAMDSTGPFTAPCGLIRIDNSLPGDNPTSVTMFVELSPGPYKGVLARPMQDVN